MTSQVHSNNAQHNRLGKQLISAEEWLGVHATGVDV